MYGRTVVVNKRGEGASKRDLNERAVGPYFRGEFNWRQRRAPTLRCQPPLAVCDLYWTICSSPLRKCRALRMLCSRLYLQQGMISQVLLLASLLRPRLAPVDFPPPIFDIGLYRHYSLWRLRSLLAMTCAWRLGDPDDVRAKCCACSRVIFTSRVCRWVRGAGLYARVLQSGLSDALRGPRSAELLCGKLLPQSGRHPSIAHPQLCLPGQLHASHASTPAALYELFAGAGARRLPWERLRMCRPDIPRNGWSSRPAVGIGVRGGLGSGGREGVCMRHLRKQLGRSWVVEFFPSETALRELSYAMI